MSRSERARKHHKCHKCRSALADTALISTSIWSLHLMPARSPRLISMQDQCTILGYAPRTTLHPQHSSYEPPPAPRQRSERKGSLSTLADTALVHASTSSLDGMCERSWQLKPVIPSVIMCIVRPSIHSIHHIKCISRCEDGPGARLMAWRSDGERQQRHVKPLCFRVHERS